MTETKFTPGPWEAFPASNYNGFAIAPKGVLPTLAAVERPKGIGNTINITAFNFPGATEANAHLIAAAPELYEKLSKIRGWINVDAEGPWGKRFYAEVDALLAKARGEA